MKGSRFHSSVIGLWQPYLLWKGQYWIFQGFLPQGDEEQVFIGRLGELGVSATTAATIWK